MKTWKKIVLWNVSLSLFGAAVLLAAFEIYVRNTKPAVLSAHRIDAHSVRSPTAFVDYSPKGKRLIPNSRGLIKNHFISGKDVSFRTNAMGFRGADFSVAKPENEIRIIALGDSITIEDYLDEKDTWPRILEHRLNEAAAARTIRVVNAGIGGAGLREEVDLLDERGLAISPDWVVLGFYLNDSRPPWGFTSELAYPGWWRRHSRLVDTLYRNLTLNGWLEKKGTDLFQWVFSMDRLDWRNKRQDFLQLARDARHDWGAAWYQKNWIGIAGQMDRLVSMSEKCGFRVAVVLFPVCFQVYSQFLENTPQRTMTELCQRREVPVLDLLPLMRTRPGERIFFDQCHPTPEANRWISEAVFDFLREPMRQTR